MAIAGWLLIGVALLVGVMVINNSWQPLLDQFRQTVGGAGAAPATAAAAPGTDSVGQPFAQSGLPEGRSPNNAGGAQSVSSPAQNQDSLATQEALPGQIVQAPGELAPTA